jgi:hypothetical protein
VILAYFTVVFRRSFGKAVKSQGFFQYSLDSGQDSGMVRHTNTSYTPYCCANLLSEKNVILFRIQTEKTRVDFVCATIKTLKLRLQAM